MGAEALPSDIALLDERIRNNVKVVIYAKDRHDKDVAEALDMNPSSFSKMLAGKERTLRPSHLVKIAEYLEADVSLFYARDDNELAEQLGIPAAELLRKIRSRCFLQALESPSHIGRSHSHRPLMTVVTDTP